MSSANHTSKSGIKACSSPDDSYEDELVTWLQYPLGDSVEKGYCSDLFEQWSPNSAVTLMPPTTVGTPRIPAGPSASTRTCAFSENGPMSRSDCVSVSCDSGNSDVKERVGSGSTLLRANSAEGALALGAERAAGLASLMGRDAFNRVRTSVQPPVGSQLTPLSISNATGVQDQLVQSRMMASPGALMSKLPPHSPQGKLQSPSRPFQPSAAHCGASPPSSLASAVKSGLSNFTSFTSYRSKSLPEAPIQMPSTQDSGCSRVTEEMSAQRASEYVSSASSRGHTGTAQMSGATPARFSSLAVEGRNQRTAGLGMSEMALPSSSCRSLSGTTLSTREESSYSGKRRFDDSESQSEDVEGESVPDAKQPRKVSSSKRNRAAEVHNLSERNRRNRINEKLKALQDLIPNSSKTDKASILDEAIEYMKTLQMQLQMVSLRSGLSVSPMMIPLGMPHLQMAPLHPVGLGVPIGHPGMGMGMGVHMSMGMGMMDVPHGMLARPAQSMSPHLNQFSAPLQGRSVAGSLECSLDSTNMGSIPSQFMPVPQNSTQLPNQMHPGLQNSFSGTHLHQQGERWQSSGHHNEPEDHFREQCRMGQRMIIGNRDGKDLI